MLSYRPGCDLGECWNAEVGHGPAAGDLVELAEFLPGACEAHLEISTSPIQPSRLASAMRTTRLSQTSTSLSRPARIGSQQGAAHAGLTEIILKLAGAVRGAPVVTEGHTRNLGRTCRPGCPGSRPVFRGAAPRHRHHSASCALVIIPAKRPLTGNVAAIMRLHIAWATNVSCNCAILTASLALRPITTWAGT